MWLPKLITTESVVLLKAQTKQSVLEELVASIPAESCSLSADDLMSKLIAREELMSTGIGLGLGIPHIRAAEIVSPVLRIGIQPAGIPDYESIDEIPVQILFMILMNDNQQREHLALLSEIVLLMKKEGLREALTSSGSASGAVEILQTSLNG